MPFQREWSDELQDYVVNRDLTGPPKPVVETGTITAEDGSIVSSSNTLDITPATPVTVTIPGPNEPFSDKNGRVNPRWYRFLTELYQRTGGINDNVNRVPAAVRPTGGAEAVIFAGVAPTVKIDPGPEMSLGSISLAGIAPTATVV